MALDKNCNNTLCAFNHNFYCPKLFINNTGDCVLKTNFEELLHIIATDREFDSITATYHKLDELVSGRFLKPAGKKENAESPVNNTQQLKAEIPPKCKSCDFTYPCGCEPDSLSCRLYRVPA